MKYTLFVLSLWQWCLRFLGCARFAWFRRWTGGAWHLALFNESCEEWCRQDEFDRVPTPEKRIVVTEVW